ncbi:MAG TPA: MBL fold metallo-hydrolase [Acidimicrobiia bacterium]|nr:MBL fold metallo-hydrolase [Acidimicrobiia bacterium]
MKIEPIRTPGLGDSTYLLTHAGQGVVIDPQRDIARFLDRLEEEADVAVRWVLETHLHNDYVSGARELARVTGAELVLPAAAAAAYSHVPAFHMEEFGDEGLVVRPIHTPGHTPEHTSYLVLIDGEPTALFSGGSLLVGSAGRPDLLGMERADSLARLQYRSVRRLAELDDEVGLYPTHGEGSFCTASGAATHTSTIAAERASNPVLVYSDEDSFVAGQLEGLQPYPTYYARMGPTNLNGPTPLPSEPVPVIDADRLVELGNAVTIVDAREKGRFAAGHIPGSLGVELRDDFGTWVGWLADYDTPMVVILDTNQDSEEALVQLYRIGLDRVAGIKLGLEDWDTVTQPLAGFGTTRLDEFVEAAANGAQILDVRSPGEWEESHIEGSIHCYVPELAASTPDLDPDRPVWIGCGSGYRAAIAAGYLTDAGFEPVVLLDTGIPDAYQRLEAAGAGTGVDQRSLAAVR